MYYTVQCIILYNVLRIWGKEERERREEEGGDNMYPCFSQSSIDHRQNHFGGRTEEEPHP